MPVTGAGGGDHNRHMADPPQFAAFPPERLELPGGLALVRPSPELVPSAVAGINESLEHLRPWMAWAQHPATHEAIAAVYAEADQQWSQRRDFLYVLVETATDRVVGGSGLHGRVGATGLEIGYWVHVELGGRGVATEVARALTTAAFGIPGIERVRIQCAVDNVRSARVPRKLGYALVSEGEPGEGPCEGVATQQWVIMREAWHR
jgi:ribosomal-protein-serine acetyltransferase